jgi:penicillin-binding protein 1A
MSEDDPFSAAARARSARLSREPGERPAKPPRQTKKPKKRRGIASILAGIFVFGLYRLVLAGVIGLIVVGGIGFYVFSAGLPSVDALKTYRPPLESRVYADNFQLVSELANEHRIYVPYDQIPPIVAQAFVSTEDRYFWVNPGINPLAIIRAGITDILSVGSGHRFKGASTITQQIVKNMLLDNNITFATKVKEAILAMRVSDVMTKKQVITLYLNEVDLGHNSFGIAAAAQTYFGKPLSQLDIAQAASLAALPKAPSTYDPFLHPQMALQRRNFVISRMLEDGAISQAQADAATAEPLLPHNGGPALTVPNAGYFADAVRSQLIAHFGADTVAQGGLIIHTSLEPVLQQAATDAVRDGLEKYDQRYSGFHGLINHVADDSLPTTWPKDLAHQANPPGMRAGWRLGIVLSAAAKTASIGSFDSGTGKPITGELPLTNMRWASVAGIRPSATSDTLHPGDIVMVSGDQKALFLQQIPKIQGALICMDARTGRILAMVGGWSHDVSPYNRAIQAQRQPGSSVKPFVYLTAMQAGIQPDASVMDAPFVVQMADGTVYRPGNYEENFQGPVPMFHALEQSLNLATLHLAQKIGLPNIGKVFEAFGIVDQFQNYYPSAIGALDTTLWRMTAAYAALDNDGRQITPTLIDSVTNPDGTVLFQSAGQNCGNCVNGDPSQPPTISYSGNQLADPDSVFQMVTMMKGVVQRGTGVPAVAGITQPVAGKTGTTNNFNDAWFLGFTPGIVTGCWIGFDSPTSLGDGQTGGDVCGPIWNEFMKVALANQPNLDFAVPSGVTLQQTSFGSQTVTEAYKTGQAPGAGGNAGLVSMATPDAGSTDNAAPQPAPPAGGSGPAATLPPLY